MSSALSLWESFIVMLVMLMAGIILTFGIAMPIEEVNKNMINSGLRDVPEEWQSSSDVDFYLSAMYWLGYVLDFVGVGQFIWRAVQRQKYDYYGNPISD